MEVITASIFSAIIVLITVYSIIKVLIIALKRNEISKRKFLIFTASSIALSFVIVSLLPFGYYLLFDYILTGF